MILDIREIKTYVINLDKNIDKYNHIKHNFSKYDIYPDRFKAIYAKDLDNEYINKITDPSVQHTIDKGRSLDSNIPSLGAIGCSLSHIELWNMLLKSNDNIFFILEDDAYPVYNKCLVSNINNYINTVNLTQPDWDIIYLGWFKFYNWNNDDKLIYINKTNNESIYKINSFVYTTHSYIINKKGALKLLKNAFPIIHQIDSYISFMCMYRDLNAYRSNIIYITQKNINGTDIQTDYSIKKIINRLNNNTMFIIIISITIIILLLIVIIFILFKKLSKNNL